jgi:hypothetical protein
MSFIAAGLLRLSERMGIPLVEKQRVDRQIDMRKRFRGNAPVRGSNREAEMNIVDEKNRTL